MQPVSWERNLSVARGHIHKVSPFSNWSTPEVYEIWSGEAIIYMQEYAGDSPDAVSPFMPDREM